MVDALLDFLEALSKGYRAIMRPLLVVLFSVLTIIVLYAVFMRYVLNLAPTWSEEIARYIMVWMALLGSSIALRQGRHIGLSTLVEQIFGKYTRVVFFIADLCILAFLVIVVFSGASMAQFVAGQRSPSANLPMWVPYLAVPVGAIFMVLETLILILDKLRPERAAAKHKKMEEDAEAWASGSQY